MTAFDPNKHPRDTGGRFAAKGYSEADESVSLGTSENTDIRELYARRKEAWDAYVADNANADRRDAVIDSRIALDRAIAEDNARTPDEYGDRTIDTMLKRGQMTIDEWYVYTRLHPYDPDEVANSPVGITPERARENANTWRDRALALHESDPWSDASRDAQSAYTSALVMLAASDGLSTAKKHQRGLPIRRLREDDLRDRASSLRHVMQRARLMGMGVRSHPVSQAAARDLLREGKFVRRWYPAFMDTMTQVRVTESSARRTVLADRRENETVLDWRGTQAHLDDNGFLTLTDTGGEPFVFYRVRGG